MNIKTPSQVGVVVIGRNEGDRLRRCLESIPHEKTRIVYVDSGSTDNSIAVARECATHVVGLDMTKPFSAARARNAGYAKLIEIAPDMELVQFIDGDCELVPGWLDEASDTLLQQSAVAIVAGRLNEKNPSASIYNRLADLEWNFHGAGEVDAVGGIFMVRSSAFDQAGGFDPSVTAGEEPELCQRLRNNQWRIIRIASNMAYHDLAMTRFPQWWHRQIRTGYSGLDVATRFGLVDFRKNSLRARFWSAWLLASLAFSGSVLFYDIPFGFMLAGIITIMFWPLQAMRIALRQLFNGSSIVVSMAYAWFTMLSFWPQTIGQVRYLIDMKKNRGVRLIEYKAGTEAVVKRNKQDKL